MNLFFLNTILIILICSLPIASSNFTVLKNLLANAFKPADSTNLKSHSKNELLENSATTHAASTVERSSLISEEDHKIKTGNSFLKNGLFRNNLIVHLQDMLSRKSVETDEQDSIVNIGDLDENPNDDDLMKNDNEINLDTVNKLNNGQFMDTLNEETANDHDEDNNSEKNFNFGGNLVMVSNTDEHLSDQQNQQDNENEEDGDEDEGFFSKFFRRKSTNHKKSSIENNLNQTIRVENSTNDSLTIDSLSLDNKSSVSSYVYLGKDNDAKDSNAFATASNSKLLGNTLESLEKIMKKYTFLNLYSAPTINETHNDRDLHQKEDEKVVLKANFVDYPDYQNTNKSTIIGLPPPVQNLTDFSFGNFLFKNNQELTKQQSINASNHLNSE